MFATAFKTMFVINKLILHNCWKKKQHFQLLYANSLFLKIILHQMFFGGNCNYCAPSYKDGCVICRFASFKD